MRALHGSGKLGAGIGDTNGLGLRVLIWGCEASGDRDGLARKEEPKTLNPT